MSVDVAAWVTAMLAVNLAVARVIYVLSLRWRR